MEKIESIANQLYQHGIEQSEKKSIQIIADAEHQAAAILAKAKNQAREIEEQAQKQAEKTQLNITGELKLASTRVLNDLQRTLTNTISDNVFSNERKALASDPDFLKELIIEITKTGKQNSDQSWEVLLPAALKDKMEKQVQKELIEALDNPNLIFHPDLAGGFRIRREDQDYHLDFSDKALAAFFSQFLKEKTAMLLFEDG